MWGTRFRATAADLYFPQVVICNSNFIQATFIQEYNITDHANLLIKYFFSGSPDVITDEEKKIIQEIEVCGFFLRDFVKMLHCESY